MEELMKSFGLIADEELYWFVTHEDKVRGNFLLITYPDRIHIHNEIKIIENKIFYTNLIEVNGYKNAKEMVAKLLKETKEIQMKQRLEKIQRDF